MENVWQDQNIQSPQHHHQQQLPSVETPVNGGPSCSTNPSPNNSRPDSPAGPSGPEAIPSTYHATVSDADPTEGLTVIRSLNDDDDENHQPIYQNLSGFPTTMVSTYPMTNVTSYTNSYGTYASKLGQYDIGNGTSQNTVLHQGYESPSQHSMVPTTSPSPASCTYVNYGTPASPYPNNSHSPIQSSSQPMWGVLGSLGPSSYCLGTEAMTTGTVDGTEFNKEYLYTNTMYMPTSAPQASETLWATYDKAQTLPPMSAPHYLQDSRRSLFVSQDYLRTEETFLNHNKCAVCGNPEGRTWNRDGQAQLVCNTCCGFKNGSRSVSTVRPSKRLSTSRRVGMTCSNCQTTDTTLWRRNGDGQPVCNACGLYYKLHQVNRPISMRKDSIQTRKRKPKSNGMSSRSRSSSANGSTKSKTAPAQSNIAAELQVYMPPGPGDSAAVSAPSPSSHHSLSSPVLPSSAALSQQQMQHLTPLDPPQQDPGAYLLSHGLDPHSTVISIGHK